MYPDGLFKKWYITVDAEFYGYDEARKIFYEMIVHINEHFVSGCGISDIGHMDMLIQFDVELNFLLAQRILEDHNIKFKVRG